MISETHIDNKSGMTVREQLEAIFRSMPALYRERDFAFRDVEERLLAQGIRRYTYKDLDDDERKAMNRYFETSVQPLLSPQVVDTHHPFPHIENKSLHIAVMMKAKEGMKFGIIPVPKALPRVVFLKRSSLHYILMEDILFQHAEKIFEMYSIAKKSVISVTRNADINPDDEMLDLEEDFRHHLKKILKRRPLLSAVRLEISEGKNRALTDYLCTG
jgi:polyphosphate kinase